MLLMYNMKEIQTKYYESCCFYFFFIFVFSFGFLSHLSAWIHFLQLLFHLSYTNSLGCHHQALFFLCRYRCVRLFHCFVFSFYLFAYMSEMHLRFVMHFILISLLLLLDIAYARKHYGIIFVLFFFLFFFVRMKVFILSYIINVHLYKVACDSYEQFALYENCAFFIFKSFLLRIIVSRTVRFCTVKKTTSFLIS